MILCDFEIWLKNLFNKTLEVINENNKDLLHFMFMEKGTPKRLSLNLKKKQWLYYKNLYNQKIAYSQ